MLTYEQIRDSLLESASAIGLHAYIISNKIEIQTLEKEFSCLMVPAENDPPYPVRAEVSFGWDAILSSESIYGGNCSLYHNETTECIHDELDPEPFIELAIEYQFEIKPESEAVLNEINQTLFQLFSRIMNHRNLPTIRWEVAINNENEIIITRVSANHYWHVEFLDEPIVFDEIFEEVLEVLKNLESLQFIKKSL